MTNQDEDFGFLNEKNIERFILVCCFVFGFSLTWYVILVFFTIKKSQKSRRYIRSGKSLKIIRKNKKSIENSEKNKNITDIRGGDLNDLNAALKFNKIRNKRLRHFLIGGGTAAIIVFGIANSNLSYEKLQEMAQQYKPISKAIQGLSRRMRISIMKLISEHPEKITAELRKSSQITLTYISVWDYLRIMALDLLSSDKTIYNTMGTFVGLSIGAVVTGVPFIGIPAAISLTLLIRFNPILTAPCKGVLEQIGTIISSHVLPSRSMKSSGSIDSEININIEKLKQINEKKRDILETLERRKAQKELAENSYEFSNNNMPFAQKQKSPNSIINTEYDYKPHFQKSDLTYDEPYYAPTSTLVPKKVESEKSPSAVVEYHKGYNKGVESPNGIKSPKLKPRKYNRVIHTLNDLKKENNGIESQELNHLNNRINEK